MRGNRSFGLLKWCSTACATWHTGSRFSKGNKCFRLTALDFARHEVGLALRSIFKQDARHDATSANLGIPSVPPPIESIEVAGNNTRTARRSARKSELIT